LWNFILSLQAASRKEESDNLLRISLVICILFVVVSHDGCLIANEAGLSIPDAMLVRLQYPYSDFVDRSWIQRLKFSQKHGTYRYIIRNEEKKQCLCNQTFSWAGEVQPQRYICLKERSNTVLDFEYDNIVLEAVDA
jgi:hypothetical protein